jgi:ABC-type multidrug transport system ATPase subunit
VTKRYGKRYALSAVSCVMEDQTSTLLLGPNGAGKTTLVKCIMGLVRFSGRITLDGEDVSKDVKKIHSKIGYMPQQSAYHENLTVFQMCSLMGAIKKASADEIKSALKEGGLWDWRGHRMSSLSSGMRQRVGIALALLRDPPLLIFDEPTNNIDIRSQIEFQSTLKKLSAARKSVLISTHLSGFEDFADNAVILESAKIVAQGRPGELLERIGEQDTVYVRVKPENQELVTRTLASLGVVPASTREEWIGLSLPKRMKAEVIHSLVDAGCSIEDLAIERTELESGYVKLLSK